jgi:hypothetical protein
MSQLFIKLGGRTLTILNLKKNNLISCKELIIRSLMPYFLNDNKLILNKETNNFIKYSYGILNNKLIHFIDDKYYNTDELNNNTFYINIIIDNNEKFDDETIQYIKLILDN